jgi:hypothetical protein
MDESGFMKKVAGQLEVVGWRRVDRQWEITTYPSVCATWHKMGAPVDAISSHSEALAGYAVRDALIAELELSAKRIYSEMLEANNSFARMFQSGAVKLTDERDQLRAELAALREQVPAGQLRAERLWDGAGEYSVSIHSAWLKLCRAQGGEFQLYAAPVSTLAPSVVMPERKPVSVRIITGTQYYNAFDDGFNTCLDEVARLNAVQAEVKS